MSFDVNHIRSQRVIAGAGIDDDTAKDGSLAVVGTRAIGADYPTVTLTDGNNDIILGALTRRIPRRPCAVWVKRCC